MRSFCTKSCKIAAASGAPPPKARLPQAAGGSAPRLPCCYSRLYWYSFIMTFLALKNSSKNTANALFLLLPRFCPYFSFQILHFFLVGAQKYFLPKGTGYPSYATAGVVQFGHFSDKGVLTDAAVWTYSCKKLRSFENYGVGVSAWIKGRGQFFSKRYSL